MNWLKHFRKVYATRERELPAREIIKKAAATGYEPSEKFKAHQKEIARQAKIRSDLQGGVIRTINQRKKARSKVQMPQAQTEKQVNT